MRNDGCALSLYEYAKVYQGTKPVKMLSRIKGACEGFLVSFFVLTSRTLRVTIDVEQLKASRAIKLPDCH